MKFLALLLLIERKSERMDDVIKDKNILEIAISLCIMLFTEQRWQEPTGSTSFIGRIRSFSLSLITVSQNLHSICHIGLWQPWLLTFSSSLI